MKLELCRQIFEKSSWFIYITLPDWWCTVKQNSNTSLVIFTQLQVWLGCGYSVLWGGGGEIHHIVHAFDIRCIDFVMRKQHFSKLLSWVQYQDQAYFQWTH